MKSLRTLCGHNVDVSAKAAAYLAGVDLDLEALTLEADGKVYGLRKTNAKPNPVSVCTYVAVVEPAAPLPSSGMPGPSPGPSKKHRPVGVLLPASLRRMATSPRSVIHCRETKVAYVPIHGLAEYAVVALADWYRLKDQGHGLRHFRFVGRPSMGTATLRTKLDRKDPASPMVSVASLLFGPVMPAVGANRGVLLRACFEEALC